MNPNPVFTGQTALSKPRFLVVTVLVYLLFGLLLIPFHRYQINPDGISYISIARHYLQDPVWSAINVHWPPLYSWLLALLMAGSMEPLLAAKLISLMMGVGVLWSSWRLAAIIQLAPVLQRLAVAVLVPVLLSWALGGVISADLLLAALFLWYATVLLKPQFTERKRDLAMAGAIAGLGYLAKSFALPVFVVSFPVILLWSGWSAHQKWRALVTRLLVGFAAFALVAAPWVVLISLKHGKPTFGTSGAYNLALIAPSRAGDPVFYRGLTSPPQGAITHLWEDPSKVVIDHWSPFHSVSNAVHYARQIGKNTLEFIRMLEWFSPIAMGLLVFGGLMLISQWVEQKGAYSPQLGLLLISAIYIFGYLLIFVEERYLWAVMPPLMLLELFVIQSLFRLKVFRLPACAVLVALLVLPFAARSVQNLQNNKNANKPSVELARTLPDLKGRRVASTNDRGCDEWYLYLCYHKQALYHGFPSPLESDAAIARQLAALNIEYFFQTGTNPPPAYLALFHPEKVMGNERFVLYKLQQAGSQRPGM